MIRTIFFRLAAYAAPQAPPSLCTRGVDSQAMHLFLHVDQPAFSPPLLPPADAPASCVWQTRPGPPAAADVCMYVCITTMLYA